MPIEKRFSLAEAKQIGEALGVDGSGLSPTAGTRELKQVAHNGATTPGKVT